MSDFHSTLTGQHVIVCVVCKVRVESAVYQGEDMFEAQQEHEGLRQLQGWRLFISRSRRWYCPEHGPKPGHNMYQVNS